MICFSAGTRPRKRKYPRENTRVVEKEKLPFAGCSVVPPAPPSTRPLVNNPGSDLLSHAVARTVPSAVAGLTSVFGMGTGVTQLRLPPGNAIQSLNFEVRTSNLIFRCGGGTYARRHQRDVALYARRHANSVTTEYPANGSLSSPRTTAFVVREQKNQWSSLTAD